MDPLGELKKLHELHQSGALDAAEYDVMKSALLQQLLRPAPPPPTPAPAPPAPTATTAEAGATPPPRELNAANDTAMTVLGYITSPMTCLGTIFAVVNLARGNVHGGPQLAINFVSWIIVGVVYASMHR